MVSDYTASGGSAIPANMLVLETPNPLYLSVDDLEQLTTHIETAMAADTLNGVRVKVRGSEPLGAGNRLTDFSFVFLANAELCLCAAQSDPRNGR